MLASFCRSPIRQVVRPGTVLRVPRGLYDHLGLLSDRLINGEPAVVSFSADANGFIEEPISAFAQGQPVEVDGYLSSLPPSLVMRRARSAVGRPYSLIDFNCEHFVRYAHGLPTESPQLQRWCVAAMGLACLWSAAARA